MGVAVVVVGVHTSAYVMKCRRLPTPGEYLIADSYVKSRDGGKASNQALAAARLGGSPYLVVRVGDDEEGGEALQYLSRNGVDIEYVTTSATRPTGFGIAFMDEDGVPMGATELGANAEFSTEHIDRALPAFRKSRVLLTQLEIPFDLAMHACRVGKRHGLTVILDPAPADGVDVTRLSDVDVLTPNEPEAKLMAGCTPDQDVPLEEVGRRLYELSGVKYIVITTGAQGAILVDAGVPGRVSCPRITPVDTSGAGDCFNGALAVGLGEGASFRDAVLFGVRAATLSVTRHEVWPSYPTAAEVREGSGGP